MDIPDLTAPDIGDTGSTPPLPPHAPYDPLPLRCSSPPLPPRKNALGLPPTYLAHLRALLHQWLTQQTTSNCLPSTAVRPGSSERLWTDQKIQAIEKAIWHGAIIPGDKAEGKKRLLDLGWVDWAPGAARRKRIWREGLPPSDLNSRGKDKSATNTVRAKRHAPSSHEDGTRGNLSAPATGLSSLSATSTPQRVSSRPPSVASTERSQRGDGTRSPFGTSPSIIEREDEDPEQRERDFLNTLMSLRGFQRLSSQAKDEWEVLGDDLPLPDLSHRELPGAFPQSGHYRDPSPMPVAPSPPPKASAPGAPMAEEDLVKPLFCLHFPASPSGASTSTVHLRRQSSLGHGSNTDSISSANGSWWGAGGSGRRRWSGIALGMGREAEEENIEVDFVEGRFALPFSAASTTSPKRIGRGSSQRKKKNLETTETTSSVTPSAETSDADADDDDDQSSTWSGTQRAGSLLGRQTSWSALIAGYEDDIPRTQVEEGKVCLVGGTVVIRGIRRDEERQAIQKVLQLVLYTTQAMILELELLDAFRVPREPDPVPVPPKDSPATPHQASSSQSSASGSSLRRRTSHRERGERTKGFFQRLGKDTRGMFDGFMGRNKSPELGSGPLPRISSLEHPPPPTDPASDFRPDTPMSPHATGASTPMVNQATDRYIHTLDKLEAILPSPTPGLRIPMPPLLLRVREEERVRAEKIRQEVAEETSGAMNEMIDGLSRLGVPSLSREDPTRTRARAYRPGGDVRAGLAALASGMENFSGWSRLQRLELLTCTGIERQSETALTKVMMTTTTICEKPRTTSLTFWDDNDETLSDVINGITDEERVCPKPGCDAEQEEHTRWWCHNSRKVGMTVRKVEQGMGEIGLDVYVKCGECKRHTEPRLLNTVAGSFSWGKLLELLLYTDILVPKDLCEHAQKTPANLITTIRSPHTVVNLTVWPVTVLDTRLPKLQVGPNVAKRKAGRAGAVGTVDGLMKKETRAAAVDAVRAEVDTVLRRLKERCAEVRAHLAETASISSATTAEKPKTASMDGPILTDSNKLDVMEQDLEIADVALRSSAAETPPGQLNRVRQEIIAVYTRFEARLDALQKIGASKDNADDGEKRREDLPEYLGKQVHALPGSAILVREAEPSSIIAYTLSSVAYFTELTNAKSNEESQNKGESSDEMGWIIDVKRRDTPRDLLSLRTITKKRSDASLVKSEHRLPLTVAPNQPSLEVSLEQVEGRSQASDRLEDLVKSISKATAQDPVLTLKTRSPSVSESDASVSGSKTTPRLPPSIARRTSDNTRAVPAPPSAFRPTRSVSSTTIPSTLILPAQSPLSGSIPGVSTPGPTTSTHNTMKTSNGNGNGDGSKDSWSSVTSTFTNSLNTFMRLGSDMGSFRMRGGDRSLSSLMGPLSMISAMDNSLSNSNLDDRPHIQFTYTLPEKLRIECTVFYATAFDSLRRRCAIDRSILDSLARCEPWDAQGGKSKASFFMSGDKRYIVKELVSKWNVSDTQALLEIAPSYFEHLASTHNKAVALAKIVGFFSVKTNDLQTSTKKSMDLVVMENLFYKQTVSQTYDLKGIEGRKVPKTVVEGSTLFDSEWIEGQSKAPILLQPHAKRILQEAIHNDTKYLCSQGIMDYSLLLGLDHQRNELVVGLVDAIGSFNLFKTIESRGKLALTRGGEVTIIPPDQYRERFENALRQYFVACPDKWSKTSRRNHEESLPSVF